MPKYENSFQKKKIHAFFEKHKTDTSYNDLFMLDTYFRSVYGDNLCAALFTFPKFKRNYSTNYSKIQ